MVGKKTGAATFFFILGNSRKLAISKPANEQSLDGLKYALAMPQSFSELTQIQLLVVYLKAKLLLVLLETTLEALTVKIIQDPLLLLPVHHPSEKHAVFVLLESIRPMDLALLFLEVDLLIITEKRHELLLCPLGGGFLYFEITEINPPFQIALHLQLDALQRIVQGYAVSTHVQLFLHHLKMLPKTI